MDILLVTRAMRVRMPHCELKWEILDRYLESGWALSEESKCSTSQYFDIRRTKYFDKRSVKDYDADYAAASRAVICMKLVKE